MRVIAGIAKGRRLRAAAGTRPTADSVKEALFSTLGTRVAGGRVLDLYAGSGALGIEALSRGAEAATFVERDPRAVSVIRSNLEATGFSGQARVVEAPVQRFLASGVPGASGASEAAAQPGASGRQEQGEHGPPGSPASAGDGDTEAFDLVLADPPYAEDPAGVLDLLSRSPLLAPDVLVALEVAAGSLPPELGRSGKTGKPGRSAGSVEPSESGPGNEPRGSGAAEGGLTVRTVKRYGDSAILYAGYAEPAGGTEGGAR